MKDWRSIAHVMWECKYHVVIVPKYRRKEFFGKRRGQVGEILRQLCRQKDIELIEGNAAVNHIHMLLSIAPKYSVAMTMGFLKGKLSLRLFQRYDQLGKKYWGRHLWSRGYCVSTVGLDEEKIRLYVKWQEQKEKKVEAAQLTLFN